MLHRSQRSVCMFNVKRALISVSDKSGLVDFSRGLHKLGIEIISTGGTLKAIKDAGIPARYVEDVTGLPEMLDGRVKTLHPKIHGGILAIRDKKEHTEQLKKHGIGAIDLVVVNLYPFIKTIENEHTLEEAIENIDIGGPSLIRAAAKNYAGVAVIVNPNRYNDILNELQRNKGKMSRETSMMLAAEAFRYSSEYDSFIYNYLRKKFDYKTEEFPEILNLTYIKAQDLRYGENPHQSAAFYREFEPDAVSIPKAKQLHGKTLSFNNILDMDAVLEMVEEFRESAVVISKHTNPCGVARADSLNEAYKKALATDPIAAFGCVIAVNRILDAETARSMSTHFIEAILAPAYEDTALEILKQKKNIRLLEIPQMGETAHSKLDIRSIRGGLLIQTYMPQELEKSQLKVVTKKAPTEKQIEAMLFAWKVVTHVKSNAIVFANENETISIGAGQMSRVDSVKIAHMKANKETNGCVMASDAFFPFRDGIDAAAKAGVAAIIQPGGSIRDQEVIDAANEHGMAMVFTGVRCFKH